MLFISVVREWKIATLARAKNDWPPLFVIAYVAEVAIAFETSIVSVIDLRMSLQFASLALSDLAS